MTHVVRHLPGSSPTHFQIETAPGETVRSVVAPPADGYPVAPDGELMAELRWYLERFPEYPFPPATDRAERTLAALGRWGRAAFKALFPDHGGPRDGRDPYRLRIVSDDPRILAWPWEALQPPQGDPIGVQGEIERGLACDVVPSTMPGGLPEGRIHVLLVTARHGVDVAYRSISRSLVELAARQHLPVRVHLLRPPTLAELERHLAAHPGTYHMLHFDGHGVYEKGYSGRVEGHLMFEDEDGEPVKVAGRHLGRLLRRCPVPVVVLNACRSAMLDSRAGDPFAAVATALLAAGTRSVVAMAYALHVSGAQRFLPAFYQRFFETGRLAAAVSAGRRRMAASPDRLGARGPCSLQDWLLPVLYRSEEVEVAFRAAPRRRSRRKSEVVSPLLVGRDGELLAIERALRRQPAAIVVHGLRGVGKTTLIRGLIDWLERTGGLATRPIWLPFQEITGFDEMLGRMEEALGVSKPQGDADRRIESLAERLRGEFRLIVGDRFDLVRGIPATRRAPRFRHADQSRLLRFLRALRGGGSKVIVTSRHPEDWLEDERQLVPLRGLAGEERWLYSARLLEPADFTIPRDDPDFRDLLERLRGHPSAMRRILPQLVSHRAEELVAVLRGGDRGFLMGDGEQGEPPAIRRFLDEELPLELRALLVPLALHEGVVDIDDLESMAEEAALSVTRAEIDRLMTALRAAGLVDALAVSVFEIHPFLTPLLRLDGAGRTDPEVREAWVEAFVDVKALVADDLAPLPPHEQERLQVEKANFLTALAEARHRDRLEDQFALLQALAVNAQNRNRFAEAGDLFRQLVLLHRVRGDERNEAAAFHHLGMIAEEERAWARAEHWYEKSLALKEKLGDEKGAAITCHQLGVVAEERQDPGAAERWYEKAREIRERIGDEPGLASTYHQLGILHQKADQLAVAETWYEKALAIKERLDDGGVVSTYHQLGMLAERREDYSKAKRYYKKSLRRCRRTDQRYGVALACHHLGSVYDEEGDVETSESWYLKAIRLFEELGHRHHAAVSYSMLAIAVARQGRFVDASGWLIKAILELELHDDAEKESWCRENYLLFYEQAPDADQEAMRRAWLDALGEWPLDGE